VESDPVYRRAIRFGRFHCWILESGASRLYNCGYSVNGNDFSSENIRGNHAVHLDPRGHILAKILKLNAAAIPMVALGALAGVFIAKKIPQKAFNSVVLILAVGASLALIFR